ncbi:MAG: hypothetical protein R3B48_07750 [Kofleriaceae bacterium]
MKLHEVLTRVPNAVAAAWVDTRTGDLLDKRAVGNDPHVSFGLEVMTSSACSQDRPLRTVLISATHVFIAQRPTPESARVLLVACTRIDNIGFSIAAVRMAATSESPL